MLVQDEHCLMSEVRCRISDFRPLSSDLRLLLLNKLQKKIYRILYIKVYINLSLVDNINCIQFFTFGGHIK